MNRDITPFLRQVSQLLLSFLSAISFHVFVVLVDVPVFVQELCILW